MRSFFRGGAAVLSALIACVSVSGCRTGRFGASAGPTSPDNAGFRTVPGLGASRLQYSGFPYTMPTIPGYPGMPSYPGMPGSDASSGPGGTAGGSGFGAFGEGHSSLTARSLIELPAPSTWKFEPVPMDGPAGSAGEGGASRAAAAAAAAAELATSKSALSVDLSRPVVSIPAAAPSMAEALTLASRRFAQAKKNLDPVSLMEFSRLVTWIPGFAKPAGGARASDRELARKHSWPLAQAISYADRADFIVAYAAAVFSLDPSSPAAAGNLANSLATAGERLNKGPGSSAGLQPWREDAILMNRYALSLAAVGGKPSRGSLVHLVNLGNLYIDLARYEEAMACFLRARAVDRRSWAAAMGLSAYYIGTKRPNLAKAVLEDDQLLRPALYAAMKRSSDAIDKTERATDLRADSPEKEFESVIAELQGIELATAADPMGELDQSARNKIKYFVENLAIKGSYRAPEIKLVSQFSSLAAISAPPGVSALADFTESLGMMSLKRAPDNVNAQLALAERLGLKIDLGFDINDVAAHPEKYENYEPDVKVSGIGEVNARARALGAEAGSAERDLATRKTDSSLALAAKIDPIFVILQIDPAKYSNPSDILVQRQNLVVLYRKYNAYGLYLYKVNRKAMDTVREIVGRAYAKLTQLQASYQVEMDAFDKERSAAAARGADTDTVAWRRRAHAIHEKFRMQGNNLKVVAWNQATQVAAVTYTQKIKPNAEAMYYDLFRHVALISDPAVRLEKDGALRSVVDDAVTMGLNTVVTAFGSLSHDDEWDCGCDLGSLEAQAEEERAALEKDADKRIARSIAEKKRFDSGEIPPSSPLFKKLDAFGTDLDIPFIPFLSGRISCARSDMKLAAEIPGAPSLSYSYTESANTGATTHGGAIEVGFGKEVGPGSFEGKLSLTGSVSFDGKGKMSDYTLDLAGKVTAKVEGTLGSAETSFEASTERGCTLSGKVEQNLKPLADMAKAHTGDLEELTDYLPENEEARKEIWSGEYKL